ncbi:HEAT repeat domain-containing protein [Paenibacillus thiaminolyticus]|uniref:HEAT repeat domain-containing protein n=1 Tax=Paenibacillus thiaminolyticus TaxID=49283 RepID=A0A3A3GNT3_PANTH|nr:HEAT repeat domain-containing protein [Paenibacillus thiaminolyticus]RJG26894.1 HEAT repeat domain-containing protein [Paenibacillus thiaminolyticus]
MFSSLGVALGFIYVCLGLIGIGVLILLLMKARNNRLAKHQEIYLEKHQPYFVYLQRHMLDPDPFQPPKGPLRTLEMRVIQDKLMEWMDKFSGEQQQKLTALCEEMGLVDRDIKELGSLFYSKQMKAAFRLGGMRSERAVPHLMKAMMQEKDGPLLQVLARSVAKCANEAEQLHTMLQQLTRHRQSHLLAAEVLEETRVNATPMLVRCLKDESDNMVKAALLALSGQTDVALTPALLPLVDSHDKEIRALAVKMLVRAGHALTENNILEWIKDPAWEIRAAVAEALGHSKNTDRIPVLKQALTDSNWWVRYYSANSLSNMGDEGFHALCEAALETDDHFKSDMAKDRIHKELLREHFFAGRREQGAGYQPKRIIYEQYFGEAAIAPLLGRVGGDYSA